MSRARIRLILCLYEIWMERPACWIGASSSIRCTIYPSLYGGGWKSPRQRPDFCLN